MKRRHLLSLSFCLLAACGAQSDDTALSAPEPLDDVAVLGALDAGASGPKDVHDAAKLDAKDSKGKDAGGAKDVLDVDVAAPEIAETDDVEADLADPDDVADTTEPDLAAPDLALPDLASPDVSVPDVPGPDCGPLPDGKTHVLFLGNSYTYTNDLPGMLVQLAASGGHAIVKDQNTPGGWTLGAAPSAHAVDPVSLGKLAQAGWQVVVLQEQSQIPAIPPYFSSTSLPGGKTLAAKAREASSCVRVVLFQTWGRKDGAKLCAGTDPCFDYKDFGAMQDALTAAYATLAQETTAEIAPVGEAWRLVRKEHPEIELFSGDGSHPAAPGTYLAACVFYARVFGVSPVGLWAPDGMASAGVLQAAAAKVVGM